MPTRTSMFGVAEKRAAAGLVLLPPMGSKTIDDVDYLYWEFTSAGETEHLIFNNNGGGSQTPDYDVILDRDYYLTVTAEGVTAK